jgi:hypothetical protein
MPIFDKLFKALKNGGKQTSTPSAIPAPNAINANSTAPDGAASVPSVDDLEESPPPGEVVDAMSLPSFRKIAAETDRQLREASEVPIELLRNYLRAIPKDEERTLAADRLLKELQGVYDFYKANLDHATVTRVIKALQPFASEKVSDSIKYSRLCPIHVSRATLLPELFEDFKEAFRCEDKDEQVEEKKQKPPTSFRP